MAETRTAIVIDIERKTGVTTFGGREMYSDTEHEASFLVEPPSYAEAATFVGKLFEALDGDEFDVRPIADPSGGLRWEHPMYKVTARPSTLMQVMVTPPAIRLSDVALAEMDAGQLREHAAIYAAEHGMDEYVEAIVLALMSLTEQDEGTILDAIEADVEQIKEGS